MARTKKNRRPQPSPVQEPARRTLPVWLTITAVVLFVIGAGVLRSMYGEDFREATVTAACEASNCNGRVLTALGWLMITSPLILGAIMATWWRRARIPLTLAAIALALAAIMFLPFERDRTIVEMLGDDAGVEPMASGMTWGFYTYATLFGVAILLGVLSSKIKINPKFGFGTVIALAVAMLAIAITQSRPTTVSAADIFRAPTVKVGDDILTLQFSEDRTGCENVLTDSSVLTGCLQTVEATYTTTGSDAVARISAIRYPSNDTAWDRWGEIRSRNRPANITGDTLAETTVTSEWLTVVAVKHADGRPIADTDRGWLTWTANQAEYIFRTGIDYSLTYLPTPTGSVSPSPTR